MQDEPRQIDTLLAQHEFLFLKRVLRGRLQCAKNILYSRYIIRLNALRNIWISRWFVFCQCGCCDAVGFKTGFVMAGGLVVIDWSVAIVSFITDLVIAGARASNAQSIAFLSWRNSTKLSSSLPISTLI